MSHPDSPLSQASHPPEDEDAEMIDADEDEEEDHGDQEGGNQEENPDPSSSQQETRSPRENRKDKDLNSFLNSMDKYSPIVPPLTLLIHKIPDAVTDYYLSLAGFECSDQRVYVAFLLSRLVQ